MNDLIEGIQPIGLEIPPCLDDIIELTGPRNHPSGLLASTWAAPHGALDRETRQQLKFRPRASQLVHLRHHDVSSNQTTMQGTDSETWARN